MKVLSKEVRLYRTGFNITKKGCWEWKGFRNENGYGKIPNDLGAKPVSLLAHRVSYEMHKQDIPEGMLVMHICDNPPCVNPLHLTIGSPAENALDMAHKGRMTTRKLNEQQAKEIYLRCRAGENKRRVAELYSVSPATVTNISNGKVWGWLTSSLEENNE